MPAARTQVVPPSAAWAYPVMMTTGGVCGAVVAHWFAWPGVALAWLAVACAGWMSQAPTLTGLPDATKRPTPANPAEQSGLDRYRFWTALRWKVLLPGRAWWPWDATQQDGWWARVRARSPRGSRLWLLAVSAEVFQALTTLRMANAFAAVLALASFMLPSSAAGVWGPAVNAVGAYGLVSGWCAVRRANAHVRHPRTAVRLDTVAEAAVKQRSVWGWVAAGAVLGVGAAVAVLWFSPAVWGVRRWVLAGAVVVLAAWLLGSIPVLRRHLAAWKALVAADELWSPRWDALKMTTPPFLYDHQELGDGAVTVDTFRMPPTHGATWFTGAKERAQLANLVGAGSTMYVLSVLGVDAAGQPQPGTRHPLDVRIVVWATGAEPDVTSSDTDPALVKLFVECAVAAAFDDAAMPRPVLDDMRLISEPATDPNEPAPALYEVAWSFPEGGGFQALKGVAGQVGAVLGADCAVDHRAGQMFLGARMAAVEPVATQWEHIDLDDLWRTRWGAVLKMGVTPPLVQTRAHRTADLADGTTVTAQAFAVGLGQNPADFMGPKIDAALTTAGSFAVLHSTGFAPSEGHRAPNGIDLLYVEQSLAPLPSHPGQVVPGGRWDTHEAQQWLLAGMINVAFDAAKLARPQMVRAWPLTQASSQGHIWAMTVRLYDGLTTPDVLKRAQSIAQTWGVKWLRIGPAGDNTLTLYAGAHPSEVLLVDAQTQFTVLALDWKNAWVDAKVHSPRTGEAPELVEVSHLEKNPDVAVLDFRLPADVSVATARAAKGVLSTSTVNEFVEFRPGVLGANSVRVLASTDSPMPDVAPYDFTFTDPKGRAPIGTRVDGEVELLDLAEDPHLMFFGTSGSGKSVSAAGLLYGSLAAKSQTVVIDVQKRGADFKFAKDYCWAFATELQEAAATLRALYAIVGERKDLNAQHGVGSVRDLPPEIRPGCVVVFIDEFLGLIRPGPRPPSKPEEDPEQEEHRQERLAQYQARKDIGFLCDRIAAEARSADVHLILMTQSLTKQDMDAGISGIKTNLARLLLGKPTQGDRMSALRDEQNCPSTGMEVPKGRGVFESTSAPGELVQMWYASPDAYAEQLRQRVPVCEAKLAIASFMPPPVRKLGVVVPSLEDEQKVIDLGTETVTLDDLDEFDEFDDGAFDEDTVQDAAIVEPPAQHLPAGQAIDDTVIVLDVDGVVAPMRMDDHPTLHVPGFGTVAYRADTIAALAACSVPIVWATDWQADAARTFNPLFGTDLPVLNPTTTSTHGWWKIDAIEQLAAAHPDLARMIWLDDRAHDACPLGITWAQLAADILTEHGIELIAPQVDPDLGADPAMLTSLTSTVDFMPGELDGADQVVVACPEGADLDSAPRGTLTAETDDALLLDADEPSPLVLHDAPVPTPDPDGPGSDAQPDDDDFGAEPLLTVVPTPMTVTEDWGMRRYGPAT